MRLTEIDSLIRPEHHFLDETDKCFFIWEYKPGGGFEKNSLIMNLKKSPLKRMTHPIEYGYKQRDIRKCAMTLSEILNPNFVRTATFVPVPCSKYKSDPEYDDRMEQICRGIDGASDVRCIVFQTETTKASHASEQGERLSIDELKQVYKIDHDLIIPPPKVIAIVDDVLTTGRHFKAMKAELSQQFPEAKIYGIFIARRVIEKNIDFDADTLLKYRT